MRALALALTFLVLCSWGWDPLPEHPLLVDKDNDGFVTKDEMTAKGKKKKKGDE